MVNEIENKLGDAAHTHTHTRTYIHTHIHTHGHTHARTYTHMHIHTHAHTHTCTYTHTCTHTGEVRAWHYPPEVKFGDEDFDEEDLTMTIMCLQEFKETLKCQHNLISLPCCVHVRNLHVHIYM